MSDQQAPQRDTLAILTLRRHQDGVWIHRLVEALRQQHDSIKQHSSSPPIHMQVVVLEEFLQGPFCVSEPQRSGNSRPCATNANVLVTCARWIGLVNRVSDAAEPHEVKACLAVLQLAKQVWNIPVWNGPDAYSLCTHKWCHHVLFQQANLLSPTTVVVSMLPTEVETATADNHDKVNHSNSLETKAVGMLHRIQQETTRQNSADMETMSLATTTGPNNDTPTTTTTMDYLIKPNAGGFGAGIERRQAKILQTTTTTGCDHQVQWMNAHLVGLPTYSDRFVLFQNYVKPQDHGNKIYRVWFLMGKVQCAVERDMDMEPTVQVNPSVTKAKQSPQSTPEDEFTSGCVGGVCQRRPQQGSINSSERAGPPRPHIRPWSVTEEVRREIEEQLAPVLPWDAHCGSVEFLYYTSPTTNQDATKPMRLYFDLNLLSTLPVEQTAETKEGSHSSQGSPDPWLQLASAILKFIEQ